MSGEAARVASAVAGRSTPMVLVDAQAARANIALGAALSGTAGAWRPHVKTVRTAFGIGLLRAAGIARFKASTLGEAAALAAGGARDVLLAVTAGPLQRSRLGRLAGEYPSTSFSVLVDAEPRGDWPANVGAFIDLDTGMGRTGLPAGDPEAVRSAAEALAGRGIRLAGLHAYDGHLADLPPAERAAAVWEAMSSIRTIARSLESAGRPAPEIVLGGTHTLPQTRAAAERGGLADRVSVGAGTLVYGDGRSAARFQRDGGAQRGFSVAAFVAARVVSVAGDRVTLDAGLTAVQLDAGTPHVSVVGRPDIEVLSVSQEHLVLRDRSRSLLLDEPVLLVPRHIDTALSQFNRVFYLDGSEIVDSAVLGRH